MITEEISLLLHMGLCTYFLFDYIIPKNICQYKNKIFYRGIKKI